MAQYNETNYKSLYGSSGSIFPDNTVGAISEGDMRQFGQDSADSLMFKSVYGLDLVTVDTTPGTLEFDFELKQQRIFKCSPAFGGTSKVINLSNFTNALKFTFIFELSGGAGITFVSIGSGIRMDDARWSLGPDIWIEPGDGKFLGEATYDGTDWFIKISQGPYVKT